MTDRSRRDIRRALDRLESGDDRDSRRRPLPPEQRRRLEAAFRAVDEPVDPEELAERFVYGPQEGDDVELTSEEAAAIRTVDWRERHGEEPPWSDDADGVGRGTGPDSETSNSDRDT